MVIWMAGGMMFQVEGKNDIVKGLEVEKVKVHLKNSMRMLGGGEDFGSQD